MGGMGLCGCEYGVLLWARGWVELVTLPFVLLMLLPLYLLTLYAVAFTDGSHDYAQLAQLSSGTASLQCSC